MMRYLYSSLCFAILPVVLSAALNAQASGIECMNCHEDVLKKTYKHEPAVMDCGLCHEVGQFPHPQNGKPKFLRDKTNNICLSCHERDRMRLAGGHVIEKHPVELDNDPMWDTGNPTIARREFNCASCHNPHSSNMDQKLFRYNYKSPVYGGSKCAVCHYDKYFGEPAPLPPLED
ncbi:MAG TPA: nitrate reductase cytochrome c-type subunit [Bdellovibrionota bacterium]|nr:nitrate reductase cytochrome c-type subunit [Bdellovibrionota bacterium]